MRGSIASAGLSILLGASLFGSLQVSAAHTCKSNATVVDVSSNSSDSSIANRAHGSDHSTTSHEHHGDNSTALHPKGNTTKIDSDSGVLPGYAADLVPEHAAKRIPYGFGAKATGDSTNNRIIVTTLEQLRAAFNMSGPRTVVVRGTITGDDPNKPQGPICDGYVKQTPTPNYNHDEYILSTDPDYVAQVELAANSSAHGKFEGRDARAYLAELRNLSAQAIPYHKAHIVQMKHIRLQVSHGDLTLVGEGTGARILGIDVYLSNVNNIIVRNLWFSQPEDCFPTLERPPSAFNANYGSLSVETVTDLWVDGCTFAATDHVVTPKKLTPNLWSDGFDGVADMTKNTDRVTFSHNLVAYVHKALLWGASDAKEENLVAHITAYGNHFKNVGSRGPMLRSGVFHIVNNLYESYNNEEPVIDAPQFNPGDYLSSDGKYTPPFFYHIGICHRAQAIVGGHVFKQTGKFADSPSRIFSFRGVGPDVVDASLCAGEQLPVALPSTFNGKPIDLAPNAKKWFEFWLQEVDYADTRNAFATGCDSFDISLLPPVMPVSEVEAYVLANAGSAKV